MQQRRWGHFRGMVAVCVALVCALTPSVVGAYDWLQFNDNSQHSGNNTQETAITAANAHGLQPLFQVPLPSNADSAPVELQGVTTASGAVDLVFVTTRAGHLIALNGRTGATVWSVQHGAPTCQINNPAPVASLTNPCHTNASPAIDPNRQFIYAYGLDGLVHKHQVANGAEVTGGGWPELATTKPFNEKGSAALTIATTPGGTFLYVANGGYPGDGGDYQGHVTTINLANGAQHVFNALCSNQAVHFAQTPGTPDCAGQTQSAIWARSGVVYDAATGKVYMATGNGTFDPANHHWGDTVFALNPDGTGNASGDPLDTYTPTNQSALNAADADLGSTAPAILPTPAGCAVPNLAVQGGKDGKIRLLNLSNLSGQGGPGHVGGELAGSLVAAPGNGLMLTAPAVWMNPADSTTWVFPSTTGGVAGLRLSCPNGGPPSLQTVWQHTAAGMGSTSSPLVANGVLYAAINSGLLSAFAPTTGATLWSATVGSIHWESPLVANGVVYLADQGNRVSAFALPAIARLSSSGGFTTGGAPVTIAGNGFVAGATVRFGGVAAASVSFVDSTTITATTPAHAAGTVDVTVTNPDGTVATLPNSFTFVQNPAPTSRSPSGPPGTPGAPPPGRSGGTPSGAAPAPVPARR